MTHDPDAPCADAAPATPHRLRARWAAALSALTFALLSACGGGGDAPVTPTPPTAAVARIEVTPAAALLAQTGATQRFTAQAYAADGTRLDVPVTWASSRPAMVALAGDGTASALAVGGAAQVTASAGGVTSAPALALAAVPSAGVQLIDDAALVGDATEVDASAEPDAANRYRITLTGVPAPAGGTLLLGRGAKPLAGRVVDVLASGAQTQLTMELVPLQQLFQNLVIDERFDLSTAEVLLSPEVQSRFDVVREGNRWSFAPRPGASGRSGPDKRALNVVGTHARDILPFSSCDVSLLNVSAVTSNPLSLAPPVIGITINPSYDIRYDSATGLERLVVEAEPDVNLQLRLNAVAKVSGSVKCSMQLFALRLPIAGPLAFFIGGLVPIGVGFDFDAATEFATFGAGAKAHATAKAKAGIACLPAGGCGFERDITNASVKVEPVIDMPSLPEDLQLTAKLHAFGWLEAELGNPLLRSLRFKGFDARIGGELDGRFAAPLSQIADTAFAASYKASLKGRAKVGTHIDSILRLLSRGAITQVELAFSQPLATSPKVLEAQADRSTFNVGDPVNVTVRLDPATTQFLPGLDNVASVQLRRRVGGSTVAFATQAAGSGQTMFSFQVTAPHTGDVSEWTAFVVTRLLPLEWLSLELAPVSAPGQDVLLVRASTSSLNGCNSSAFVFDALGAERLEDNHNTNPSTCVASLRGGQVEAAANASSSVSGPVQSSAAPPVSVTSLAGNASGSVSARATLDVNSDTLVRRAVAGARAAQEGHGELLVQGAPVTMTITGSVAGFARASATWQPSAGGAGTAGSYGVGANGRTPAFGALSHSVRLQPGQRVLFDFGVDVTALADEQNPGDSNPTQQGSVSFSVTFTP